MGKKKENPKQWLPDDHIADAACTLLQLWSRYCWEIANFRNFKSTDTVYSYTAILKQIEPALSQQSICDMSIADIWDAITSAQYKRTAQGNGVAYSPETIRSRYSVIHDIFLFAEAKVIWSDTLCGFPWDKLKDKANISDHSDGENSLQSTGNKRTLPRHLSIRQEQRLMREIITHIEEDGRWIALAVLLWDGPRISEVRRSYFGDLKAYFDHPEHRFLRLCRSADAAGNEQNHMKNKYGPRSIPEHEELRHIISLRESFIRRKLGQQDISMYPIICYENQFARVCTAQDLYVFVQTQLRKLFGVEFWAEISWLSCFDTVPDQDELDGDVPDDPIEQAIDMELSSRLARRNFATKNYSETRLEDWQSRKTMGHQCECPVSAPYSEGHLWIMHQLMSHRMILPEIHSGWHTICSSGMDCIEQSDVGIHYISVPQRDLSQISSISIDIELEQPGDDFFLEFFRKIPADCLSLSVDYVPETPGAHTGRINTDCEHWPISWETALKDLEKNRNG